MRKVLVSRQSPTACLGQTEQVSANEPTLLVYLGLGLLACTDTTGLSPSVMRGFGRYAIALYKKE